MSFLEPNSNLIIVFLEVVTNKLFQDHADKMMKEFGDIDRPDDTLLFRTALLLNDVEGLTNKTELQVLLRKLPIEDVNYLRNTG